MATTKLKRMDRFELLELIYDMRKANQDLTERLEAAEKRIEQLKKEADERVESQRAEYMQRIDDLRMQGAAKELQKRMNEIEEQLIAFQRITGKAAPLASQENDSLKEQSQADVFTPPLPADEQKEDAAPDAPNLPPEDFSASVQMAGEAGESRE